MLAVGRDNVSDAGDVAVTFRASRLIYLIVVGVDAFQRLCLF